LCFLKFISKEGKNIEIGKPKGEIISISGSNKNRPICLFGKTKVIYYGRKII